LRIAGPPTQVAQRRRVHSDSSSDEHEGDDEPEGASSDDDLPMQDLRQVLLQQQQDQQEREDEMPMRELQQALQQQQAAGTPGHANNPITIYDNNDFEQRNGYGIARNFAINQATGREIERHILNYHHVHKAYHKDPPHWSGIYVHRGKLIVVKLVRLQLNT
jgi:hypothetical protein